MKHFIQDNKMKDYRYERKFVTKAKDFEIEHFIKHNKAIFSEAFEERRVNNLYLDDIELKSYQDNINGNLERVKIRIRWYGSLFGPIKPILEIKIKTNNLGKKLSFPLIPFVFDKNFSHELFEKEIISKSKIPDWIKEKLLSYRPSLLNTYKRRYFVSADRRFRITLDKDLAFFRIEKRNNQFKEKIARNDLTILELKYPSEFDSLAQEITQGFPLSLAKSSKYVLGIEDLNYR